MKTTSAARTIFSAITLIAICAVRGFSQETVYFNTGFSLNVDSHTQRGQTLVLQIGGGTLEFPAGQVSRIEPLPSSAPKLPAAQDGAAAIEPEQALREAAYRQGLDLELVRSVAKIESALQPAAVSVKGATGLMQLMPVTAAQLGVDASKTESNALGGAKYLRELLIRYHFDSALALAAYNAGPAAVDKYHGIPPYAETRNYVLKVIREYQREISGAHSAAPGSASKTSATN